MHKNISIEMEYNIKYILLEILKQYEYTAKYYACNIKIETGKLLDQGYENKNQAIIRKFCGHYHFVMGRFIQHLTVSTGGRSDFIIEL
jgi:hypothetical protein